jgi:copper(I)-binding protein
MSAAPLRQVFLGLGLALVATVASAHGYKQKSIEVVHPWTFDRTEPGGRDAIVSMDIKNAGREPDRLLGASSTIAHRVEIRAAPDQSRGADKRSSAVIEIGPASRLDLTAKGLHLRLIGLKKSLTAYDTLPVTLVFEKAGRLKIDVLVEEASDQKN